VCPVQSLARSRLDPTGFCPGAGGRSVAPGNAATGRSAHPAGLGPGLSTGTTVGRRAGPGAVPTRPRPRTATDAGSRELDTHTLHPRHAAPERPDRRTGPLLAGKATGHYAAFTERPAGIGPAYPLKQSLIMS